MTLNKSPEISGTCVKDNAEYDRIKHLGGCGYIVLHPTLRDADGCGKIMAFHDALAELSKPQD